MKWAQCGVNLSDFIVALLNEPPVQTNIRPVETQQKSANSPNRGLKSPAFFSGGHYVNEQSLCFLRSTSAHPSKPRDSSET